MRASPSLLALSLCACAGGAPIEAAPPAPPPVEPAPAVSEPEPQPPPPAPPPAPPPEVRYEGARAARLARFTALARGAFDAFANVSPQPVIRGYTEVQYVQFQTDRRERGTFAWVEASTMSLHHPVEVATKIEPCARPLAAPGDARVRGGVATLVRVADHDELWFGPGATPLVATLPRGASHGACVGPDETRVWVSWSTPTSPPELFSVSRKDGSARPLRLESRPGLAALRDVRASAIELGAGARGAVLEPVGASVASAVLIEDDDAPLARWNALARFLAGISVRVIVARRPDAASAIEHASAKGAVTVVVRGGVVNAKEGARVVVLAEDVASLSGDLPQSATVIAAGDGLTETANAAATRTGGSVAIAHGTKARDTVPGAWARVADAVVPLS